jgi:hypothetical protein
VRGGAGVDRAFLGSDARRYSALTRMAASSSPLMPSRGHEAGAASRGDERDLLLLRAAESFMALKNAPTSRARMRKLVKLRSRFVYYNGAPRALLIA